MAGRTAASSQSPHVAVPSCTLWPDFPSYKHQVQRGAPHSLPWPQRSLPRPFLQIRPGLGLPRGSFEGILLSPSQEAAPGYCRGREGKAGGDTITVEEGKGREAGRPGGRDELISSTVHQARDCDQTPEAQILWGPLTSVAKQPHGARAWPPLGESPGWPGAWTLVLWKVASTSRESLSRGHGGDSLCPTLGGGLTPQLPNR